MMAFIAEQLLCRKNVEQYPTAQNAVYIKQNKINIAGLAILLCNIPSCYILEPGIGRRRQASLV